MLLLLLAPLAHATPNEALLFERLAELAPLRAQRMAEGPPPIPESDYRKVAGGDVVVGLVAEPGHAARKVYGAAIVDVSVDRLWHAIIDELSHPEYTAISYAELVSGQPCLSGRAVLQYLPLPLVSDRWWITVLQHNERLREASSGQVRELAWTSSVDPDRITSEAGQAQIQRGIPIAFTKGGWFMAALDDRRTLLEYYVWTDPGGALPARAASAFASGSVRDTIRAMERFAQEGGTRCN